MTVRQIIASLGATFLMVGVFMPILGIPIFHDQSLMDLQPNVAWVLLGLAALTILLSVIRQLRWLYAPGIITLALITYTPLAIQARKDAIQSDIKQHVASLPGGLARSFVGATDLKYGWTLMMLGAVMVLAVPLLGPRLERRSRKNHPDQTWRISKKETLTK